MNALGCGAILKREEPSEEVAITRQPTGQYGYGQFGAQFGAPFIVNDGVLPPPPSYKESQEK